MRGKEMKVNTGHYAFCSLYILICDNLLMKLIASLSLSLILTPTHSVVLNAIYEVTWLGVNIAKYSLQYKDTANTYEILAEVFPRLGRSFAARSSGQINNGSLNPEEFYRDGQKFVIQNGEIKGSTRDFSLSTLSLVDVLTLHFAASILESESEVQYFDGKSLRKQKIFSVRYAPDHTTIQVGEFRISYLKNPRILLSLESRKLNLSLQSLN